MDNRNIRYGMPMKPAHVDVDLEKSFVAFLQDKGYLILAPGDSSPVAELMKTVSSYNKDEWRNAEPFEARTLRLMDLAMDVCEDTTLRAWVERTKVTTTSQEKP
jgi:hypothetical protein